jgi:small subunit ribosomal protein S26e
MRKYAGYRFHNIYACEQFEGQRNTLTKKRKSRGRSKGGKGHSDQVQCSNCGTLVPKDKAKKLTTRVGLVEPMLARELRAQGAYIATSRTLKFYCVSCAVHFGLVKVRAKDERRLR